MASITGNAGASGSVQGAVVQTPDTGLWGTTVTEDANGLNIHAIFVYDNGSVVHFTQIITPAQQVRLIPLIEGFVNPARLKNGAAGPVESEDIAAVVCALAYAQQAGQPGPSVPVTKIVRGYDIPVPLPISH